MAGRQANEVGTGSPACGVWNLEPALRGTWLAGDRVAADKSPELSEPQGPAGHLRGSFPLHRLRIKWHYGDGVGMPFPDDRDHFVSVGAQLRVPVCCEYRVLLCRPQAAQSDTSSGLVSRKGTSGEGLKEQEGVFHEEEIQSRLGRDRKGVSGTGQGTCKATVEREHLARLWSGEPSRRLTPRPREGGRAAQGWRNGGVTPGSASGERGFACQPVESGLYPLDSGEPRRAVSRPVTRSRACLALLDTACSLPRLHILPALLSLSPVPQARPLRTAMVVGAGWSPAWWQPASSWGHAPLALHQTRPILVI